MATTPNQKFNITELIEFYYNEKVPLPEKFKSMDYTEKTHKYVTFIHKGREERYDLNETIGKNIIRELPLESYKECFNLDWFKNDNQNSRTIQAAFEGKRFDLLEHVINEVAALKPEQGKEREFNGDLRVHALNTLTPISNCFTDVYFDTLGYTKKDIDTLYPIWEKAIDALENIQTQIWIGANKKKGKDILEQYANIQENSRDATYELMKGLNRPLTLDIFKKIFSLISETTKKKVFMEGDNPLSEEAIYNEDKKTIEFLEKENLITPTHYKNVLLQKYDIGNVSDKVTPADIWIYKKSQEVIPLEEKQNIPAHNLTGLVKKFQNTDVILNDILQNYPQLQTGNLLEDNNTSLAEIEFAFKAAHSVGFNEKQFMRNLNSGDKKSIEVFQTLIEKFPETKPVSIAPIMESSFGRQLINSISEKNKTGTKVAQTSFLEAGMDINLKPDAVDNKRIKI